MPTDRSMYVERLLQVNLAALAALGTLMLGMGQRSVAMPLIVICIAGSSVWLTDVTGRFRLNRFVANLGALIIGVVILTREFSRFGSEAHILGVARLLVYLQILLLLQKKREREYWQLAVLSLLQVVVAAAFSQGVWFGVVLVVYMLAGLSALVLLFLFRQWTCFAEEQAGTASPRKGHGFEPGPAAAVPARWPLVTVKPDFAGGTVDDSAAGVGWALSRRLGLWGTGTLTLTAILFLTVPRLGQTAWRGAIIAPQNVVGFSDKVTLGELGETIEDPKEVLRVRFLDHGTGAPYPVAGPVYLHGALLMSYQRGQWTAGSALASLGYQPLRPARRRLPPRLVRQEITIEPLNQPELFCVMPFVPTEPNDLVQIDFRRKRLLREDYLRRQRFSYRLGTTAMVGGRQQALTPGESRTPSPIALELPDDDSLPSVGRLARQWLDQSGIPPSDRYGQAKHLEHMLASSGMFRYSLKGQPRDPRLDPIEDFLTRNRAGHCEYFATALVLMLRSQGIPARMVVGYMTDEYNETGRFFQVRQLHAHTWVEAHLEPGQIPAHLLHGEQTWGWRHAGGWLQLDATPTAAGNEQLYNPWLQPFRRASLWMEQLWANYILEMDRPRQHEAVYQPIVRTVKQAYKALADPAWWREVLQAWSSAGQWFSWRGGLAAMLLAGVCMFVYRSVRWLWRWAAPRLWPGGRASAGDDGRPIAFYRRLITLLRRRGLRRAPGQTPYEFATEAAARLAGTPGLEHLAPSPQRIVQAFYQVRFGHQPLDDVQREEVEHGLSELAAARQTWRQPHRCLRSGERGP